MRERVFVVIHEKKRKLFAQTFEGAENDLENKNGSENGTIRVEQM